MEVLEIWPVLPYIDMSASILLAYPSVIAMFLFISHIYLLYLLLSPRDSWYLIYLIRLEKPNLQSVLLTLERMDGFFIFHSVFIVYIILLGRHFTHFSGERFLPMCWCYDCLLHIQGFLLYIPVNTPWSNRLDFHKCST